MDTARRIVELDDARPVRSRKKQRAGLMAGAGLLVAVVVIAVLAGLGSQKSLVAVGGYALATVEQTDFVAKTDASGTVVAPVQVTVTAPQEGYAGKVLVKEGDTVAKGQVLTVLDVPDLVDAGDDLEAQLAVARLALKSLELTNEYSVAALETAIRRREKDLEKARTELELKTAVAQLKSSRQSELDEAREALETLEEAQEDAVAELAKTRAQGLIEQDKQRASIRQLELGLQRNRDDQEEARVKSPLAGEVLSISDNLLVSGSFLEANEELMVVADRSVTYIDLEVDEQYVDALKVGDSIALTVGNKSLGATISSIGKVASMSSDGLSATVTVRTKPDGSQTLTPGGSAVASMVLGVQQDTLVLPRGAWLTTGGQKYVYKVEGNKARKTAIVVGSVQGLEVEIKSGLKAGDRILSSGYQDFIDQDVIELKGAE